MFVRGKIQIKFGTDASPVTRLIGQVFSESLRPLPATWDFSLDPSQREELEIILNLISIWDRGLETRGWMSQLVRSFVC